MELSARPHNLASELAVQIYSKVLDVVRADRLVHQAVQRVGDALFIQGQHVDLTGFERVWIAGSGKASIAMAQAAAEILGTRLAGGLIVTKAGSAEPIHKVTVLEAAHPVPDESSLLAGEEMLRFAHGLGERDFVLYLLSGGSSALMESLRDSITLDDLQQTTQTLLASGADIRLVNAVRTQLSHIKGGGLASAFAPANVVTLVLSDVVGSHLAAVGSGPFIPAQAAQATHQGLPIAVQRLLAVPQNRKEMALVQHYVIGSISLAITAAIDVCKALELLPLPFADPMRGEARAMARTICRHAEEHKREDSCMIFGGETTVKIRGKGLGGRCQEMAMAAARSVSKMTDVCFLACGTDGTDGPTDAAGGLVDPDSLSRARLAGYTDTRSLAQNDSYHFLRASQGLIKTGPTGSNVNDLAFFVRAS